MKYVKSGNDGILITGGTGFLGVHIIEQIPNIPVFVLKNKTSYVDSANLWQTKHGNVTEITDIYDIKPTKVWHLASKIHASASNLMFDNVDKWRCLAEHNNLTLASSLSVFVSSTKNEGTFYETPLEMIENHIPLNGYAASKIAAEKLFSHSTIIRFGLLTGSRNTGIQHGFYKWFFDALKEYGGTDIVDIDKAVDITPVDWAAKCFLELESKGKNGGIFHIAADVPQKLCEFDYFINPDFHNLRFRSIGLKLLRNAFLGKGYSNYDLFQSTRCLFDKTNSLKYISENL